MLNVKVNDREGILLSFPLSSQTHKVQDLKNMTKGNSFFFQGVLKVYTLLIRTFSFVYYVFPAIGSDIGWMPLQKRVLAYLGFKGQFCIGKWYTFILPWIQYAYMSTFKMLGCELWKSKSLSSSSSHRHMETRRYYQKKKSNVCSL